MSPCLDCVSLLPASLKAGLKKVDEKEEVLEEQEEKGERKLGLAVLPEQFSCSTTEVSCIKG